MAHRNIERGKPEVFVTYHAVSAQQGQEVEGLRKIFQEVCEEVRVRIKEKSPRS